MKTDQNLPKVGPNIIRLKNAKRKYRFEEGNIINSLAKKEPKKFWKNIRKWYKSGEKEPENLNIEDLLKHFKSLFGMTADTDNSDISDENVEIENHELDQINTEQ